MKRLPASFAAWCFLPAHGVVRINVEPTTLDPATAEVDDVTGPIFERGYLYVTPSEDERRRMDEAASDALEAMRAALAAGLSLSDAEEAVEQETIKDADKAKAAWSAGKAHLRAMAQNEADNRIASEREGRPHVREPHPEDRDAPEWHEHA